MTKSKSWLFGDADIEAAWTAMDQTPDAQGGMVVDNTATKDNGTKDAWLGDGACSVGVYDNGELDQNDTSRSDGSVHIGDFACDDSVANASMVSAGELPDPDASGYARIANADGSYGMYYWDASGDVFVVDYDADGNLTGTDHARPSGAKHQGPVAAVRSGVPVMRTDPECLTLH